MPSKDDPEIRRLLLEAGATPDEIEAAARAGGAGGLVDLSGEVALRPAGQALDLRQLAARAGLTIDRAHRLCTAAGLPAEDPDAPVWFESDVRWLRDVQAAAELLGEDAVLALVRRAGAATTQLAHAASGAFRVNVVPHTEQATDPARAAVERNLGTTLLVQSYVDAIAQLFRHHIRTTIRSDSVAAGAYGELRPLTVGFVDLASSTELGQRVTAAELAGLMADFDATAADLATRHGARVVKMIGDEVMLCADDADVVCRTALELVAYCQGHRTFTAARAGIAAGDVLDQNGDCYGPVVNRAARMVHAAEDGTVMVDEAVRGALPDDLPVVPRPAVTLRGIGEVRWGAVSETSR